MPCAAAQVALLNLREADTVPSVVVISHCYGTHTGSISEIFGLGDMFMINENYTCMTNLTPVSRQKGISPTPGKSVVYL
jgi:hypothetical protein